MSFSNSYVLIKHWCWLSWWPIPQRIIHHRWCSDSTAYLILFLICIFLFHFFFRWTSIIKVDLLVVIIIPIMTHMHIHWLYTRLYGWMSQCCILSVPTFVIIGSTSMFDSVFVLTCFSLFFYHDSWFDFFHLLLDMFIVIVYVVYHMQHSFAVVFQHQWLIFYKLDQRLHFDSLVNLIREKFVHKQEIFLFMSEFFQVFLSLTPVLLFEFVIVT